jgi:hypothetical protein
MATAQLTFYRRGTWQDSFRSYLIEVDGRDVGVLPPRAVLSIDVPEGLHGARAKVSWTTSPEIVVDAVVGARCNIRVVPGPAFIRLLGDRSFLTLVPD